MSSLFPIQRTSSSIAVAVDPRVELMSIVQQTSRYRETYPFLLTGADFPYRQEVEARFARYSDHPAVRFFDEISPDPYRFNVMVPPTAMLTLTAGLRPHDDVVWDDMLLPRAGGREGLETLVAHLRDFRTDRAETSRTGIRTEKRRSEHHAVSGTRGREETTFSTR